MIEGNFRTKYKVDDFSFQMNKIQLLETVKSTQTKQLIVTIPPKIVDVDFLEFFQQNCNSYPGKTKFTIYLNDELNNINISLTKKSGITLNDDIISFMEKNKEINVFVKTY